LQSASLEQDPPSIMSTVMGAGTGHWFFVLRGAAEASGASLETGALTGAAFSQATRSGSTPNPFHLPISM